MIKYYDKLLLSLGEIDGRPILLVHALSGCQLRCFHCLNRAELLEKPHEKFYTIQEIIEFAQKQIRLFDHIVFSGGEYLVASLDDLIEDLTQVKQAISKPIIIYTNGIAYDKVVALHEHGLVDGFHVDMKLPFHLLTVEDLDLAELTLGIPLRDMSLPQTILKTLEYVISTDRGYSRIRSVRYPFLGPEAFSENRLWVEKMNQKHNKRVPYDVNSFIYVPDEEKAPALHWFRNPYFLFQFPCARLCHNMK